MSETKWTKGLWSLKEIEVVRKLAEMRGEGVPEPHALYYRSNDGGWSISAEDERVAVADFKGTSKKRNEAYMQPDEVGLANARLIASAPALYEALEEMLTDFTQCDAISIEVMEKARAALRAARGEQEAAEKEMSR